MSKGVRVLGIRLIALGMGAVLVNYGGKTAHSLLWSIQVALRLDYINDLVLLGAPTDR